MAETVENAAAPAAPATPAAPAAAPGAPPAAASPAPAGAGEQNMAPVAAAANQQGQTAQTAEPPKGDKEPPAPPAGPPYGFLVVIAIMFAIMYFMLIRPQKKKERQRQEMLDSLKKGARVVSIGGIIGTIISINDREVVLETEDKNKIRFTRAAISRPLEEGKSEGK